MNVMVVGKDARGHTITWKLRQSQKVDEIFVAPGNAGTAAIAHNLNIAPDKIKEQVEAARDYKIDLVIFSPEKPLALGGVDAFREAGILAFGPTQPATNLEASKIFARRLMEKYGIPCPKGQSFDDINEARKYLREQKLPVVIKADGLAEGKGVTIAHTMEEALGDLKRKMVDGALGEAGKQVIIDPYLQDKEVSVIAFTDGKTVKPLVTARDYKRAYDQDLGPNTGGMGSYSPAGFLSDSFLAKIVEIILLPIIRAMEQEGRPYKGVLYAGLMFTPEGVVVLEFNARFGDPETQVQLPLLKTDLVDIMLAVINGTLDQQEVEWSDEACVGVVMASEGYPGPNVQTGFPIVGLDQVDPDALVFHAGTREESDQVKTADGRVLTVVGKGKDLPEARTKVYKYLKDIDFEGCWFRGDIAEETTHEGAYRREVGIQDKLSLEGP